MVKAAIVGLGRWGKTFVESVQGTSDRICFVAGTMRTVTREIRAVAEGPKLPLAEDFKVLLKDPETEAVVLTTPHSLHTEQVISAAQAGKHVFCEKPFALTKADAEAGVSATRNAGVTLDRTGDSARLIAAYHGSETTTTPATTAWAQSCGVCCALLVRVDPAGA